MHLKQIHHVAIICSDYQISRDFYTNVLGLQIISETYRAEKKSYKLDLKLANGDQLELFTFPNPPTRVTHPEALGLRHLAFAVDKIEETVVELKLAGVNVQDIRVDPVTGKRYTFFNDPDKLPIELYEA